MFDVRLASSVAAPHDLHPMHMGDKHPTLRVPSPTGHAGMQWIRPCTPSPPDLPLKKNLLLISPFQKMNHQKALASAILFYRRFPLTANGENHFL